VAGAAGPATPLRGSARGGVASADSCSGGAARHLPHVPQGRQCLTTCLKPPPTNLPTLSAGRGIDVQITILYLEIKKDSPRKRKKLLSSLPCIPQSQAACRLAGIPRWPRAAAFSACGGGEGGATPSPGLAYVRRLYRKYTEPKRAGRRSPAPSTASVASGTAVSDSVSDVQAGGGADGAGEVALDAPCLSPAPQPLPSALPPSASPTASPPPPAAAGAAADDGAGGAGDAASSSSSSSVGRFFSTD
jgi:hypothetical protein